MSVLADDSRDTADALTQLEAVWGDLRKHLEDNHADRDVIACLERAILYGGAAVGRQGRVVIATHYRVLINEHLPSPPPATVLRISDYPYVLPLVKRGKWRPTYVFAAVDCRRKTSPCIRVRLSARRPSTAAAIRCTSPRRQGGAAMGTSSAQPKKPSA